MGSFENSFTGYRLFPLVLLVATAILSAQPPTGEIQLTVNDPSGVAMHAAGTLSNSAAALNRHFDTDALGRSTFSGLPYGHYRLDVSRDGFATQTVQIDVQSSTPVVRTVTMAVAATASKVDVISATPLAGTDLSVDQIPGPVQTATAEDMTSSGALNLTELMNRRLNGVFLNDMEGNSFQADVNFRGYTASPILGTPEGISVYVDGVRQNQPFGDVVAWDLIPKNAISEVTLVPGSDPLFGLNTLGGALPVRTKDGVSDPGASITATYGASGRKEIQGEYGGGKATGFNWFLAGTGFHESGWRIASPSDVKQGFVKLGWRTGKSDLALTTSYAYNTLGANGLQDYRLLAANYASGYTFPDVTGNRSPSFNLTLRHTFNTSWNFSGNAWFRNIRTEIVNPNYNNDAYGYDISQPTAAEQAALTAAGYTGFPTSGATAANTPFPKWRCIANALMANDPDQTCDGDTVYSLERQNDYGFSAQITLVTPIQIGAIKSRSNQFAFGATVDRGSVGFTQNTAWGYINPDHTVTDVGAWQDGSTNSPVDSAVDLHGATPNWSLYFTDTLALLSTLNATVSGRYNQTTIDNTDYLNPIAGPGSLTGDYVYRRFNPSIGLTWNPMHLVNAYGRFSQGSRAPTSIELGCSDPANPCSLPNALQSDPPLQQVVTDTWEFGLRGKPEISFIHGLSWNAGVFQSENHNDILFVSSVALGTGYFQNFAKTRRRGGDASLDGRIGRVAWGLDYTFLDATYQSDAVLDGAANNTSDTALSGTPGLDGNIYVHPGNRIPLIPKQSGKAHAEYQATKRLAFDLSEVAVSSSYARGNENNAYKADGIYYLGPGVSPGYSVTNLRAHYDLSRHFLLALQIDNLFNKEYYTAAQLADTGFNAQGAVSTRPLPEYTTGPAAGTYPAQAVTFFAPGAPRRAWVELKYKF
jgi:outer membrane receptor protein involved in Fe transport